MKMETKGHYQAGIKPTEEISVNYVQVLPVDLPYRHVSEY